MNIISIIASRSGPSWLRTSIVEVFLFLSFRILTFKFDLYLKFCKKFSFGWYFLRNKLADFGRQFSSIEKSIKMNRSLLHSHLQVIAVAYHSGVNET
jgi:hypothetical protein